VFGLCEPRLSGEELPPNGQRSSKDPANLGRVQIHLSARAGGAKEWARVVSALIGRTPTAIQLGIGDEVLVAFENGDVRRVNRETGE
jgi:uncharacterized protein involved in type VI secretion and phage assembly